MSLPAQNLRNAHVALQNGVPLCSVANNHNTFNYEIYKWEYTCIISTLILIIKHFKFTEVLFINTFLYYITLSKCKESHYPELRYIFISYWQNVLNFRINWDSYGHDSSSRYAGLKMPWIFNKPDKAIQEWNKASKARYRSSFIGGD